MNSVFKIGDRPVGPMEPVFLIAEAGVNHLGRLDRALRLVDMALEAGVDAFKLQVYRTEAMITSQAPDWRTRMKAKELSYEDVRRVREYCRKKEILFLASAHDEESVDFLASVEVPAFKIGSGEINNPAYVQYVARKGKPVILSTGMHTLKDVQDTVTVLKSAGLEDLALLHCTTLYPTEPTEVNLRAMDALRENFPCPVGYSDHNVGIDVVLAAVARDAAIIEKHIALEKDLPNSWDPIVSCDATELKDLVRGVRKLEKVLGAGGKAPSPRELDSLTWARKSIVAREPIPKGATITEGMLASKRPGSGLPPSRLSEVLGRKARVNISADAIIQLEWLE